MEEYALVGLWNAHRYDPLPDCCQAAAVFRRIQEREPRLYFKLTAWAYPTVQISGLNCTAEAHVIKAADRRRGITDPDDPRIAVLDSP